MTLPHELDIFEHGTTWRNTLAHFNKYIPPQGEYLIKAQNNIYIVYLVYSIKIIL